MTESELDTALAPATPLAAKPAPASALHSLLPSLRRLLAREPALGITVAYLFVAMAGIFYNFRFYSKFGIPVMSLSQISDFLTAGIQQPIALLLVLGTFPVITAMDAINAWVRRRQQARLDGLSARSAPTRWQKFRMRLLAWSLRLKHHVFMQVMYAFVVVSYGWVFVSLYADARYRQTIGGDAAQVKIRLNGADTDLAASKSPTWTWLGAVSNYVFVYDAAARQPLILPTNNILRIEPLREATRADAEKAGVVKAGVAPELAPKP